MLHVYTVLCTVIHVKQKDWQRSATTSLNTIKTVKNVKTSYKMTELGCPGEERVNFGTQRDVLDERETITIESRFTNVCLYSPLLK